MLAKKSKYTYIEFLEITKNMERAEFIDGEIILQATPTAQHQSIVLNIASEFRQVLKSSKYKPYIAPFDVILENEIYGEPIIYSKDDILVSPLFNDIQISLLDIFL